MVGGAYRTMHYEEAGDVVQGSVVHPLVALPGEYRSQPECFAQSGGGTQVAGERYALQRSIAHRRLIISRAVLIAAGDGGF